MTMNKVEEGLKRFNEKIQAMEKINKYARRPLTEGEVYTFNIILCDNEVDKDFEAFDIEALNQMCKLCIGKTSVTHYPKNALVARIYDAWIVTDPIKKTSYGEPLTELKASAYIIRSDDTIELINEIESGEKKEISVSCSASRRICSICGKEKGYNCCSHIKGVTDCDRLCFYFLSNIQDFYEWSFAIAEDETKNMPASFEREKDETEAFKCYDGDENIVKIVTRDCNGKWTTLEMPQINVTPFLDDENCSMTEEDEIMMIFVNDVCIYSQLANGPIDWDRVTGFFG